MLFLFLKLNSLIRIRFDTKFHFLEHCGSLCGCDFSFQKRLKLYAFVSVPAAVFSHLEPLPDDK